jgi:hypothetical protein
MLSLVQQKNDAGVVLTLILILGGEMPLSTWQLNKMKLFDHIQASEK